MKSCRICGNAANNRIHLAREMMFATRDEFEYLECGACGTVQIVEVPDLSPYYPKDYYSFSVGSKTYIEERLQRRLAAPFVGRYLMTGRGTIGKFLFGKAPWFEERFPAWLRDPVLTLDFKSRILDFGSGNGALLRDLKRFGFQSLTGADAFIEKDIVYPTGVRVLKRTLAEVEGEFDLVMLNHSFEHLPDPEASLTLIGKLLAPEGRCLIRIPVASHAWQTYGVNWFQLDAPRHLFLFTERAFRDLAARSGFEVLMVVYDSDLMQFVVSEQYARDIPMHDDRAYRGEVSTSIFTPEQIADWTTEAGKLNAEGRGDQACFYLRRSL
ncbi:MAG: class I SAM-dependent methyltransferase [Acidobacteria bacterium]|nr:class I SAM-dependent methyltransferase [Acidobacteriota bacterium]